MSLRNTRGSDTTRPLLIHPHLRHEAVAVDAALHLLPVNCPAHVATSSRY